MQLILNSVAQAMAYVVRIYSTDASGFPRAIGGFDALQRSFVRGAHAFERNGQQIGRLTVQRRDMLRAIEVLRSAKVHFRASSAA